jgi:hypothetical protein
MAITKIDLGNVGDLIGEEAFYHCVNLTTIVSTGSSAAWTQIGDYAFFGCLSLNHIEFYS